MPDLSLSDIERISRDIRKEKINVSHLLEELVDHICCDVEYMMNTGLGFEDAYREVKKKIGSRRLKEIQEETLYAIDTKYRIMKKTMKISAITGTILFGLAALFKIMHWPLAGVMMTLASLIVAFIFLPSTLGVLWKETKSSNSLFLFISSFFAGLFFISGTLFKIQHWPGAGVILDLAFFSGIFLFIPAVLNLLLRDEERKRRRPAYFIGAAGVVLYSFGILCRIQHWPLAGILLVIGVILLFVIAFPLYTWLKWKDESHISPRFLFILIGSLAIIFPGALVNLSLQYSYESNYYPHLFQQQTSFNYMYRANDSILSVYPDSLNYPVLEQIHSKTGELISKLGNIENLMVQESEGKPGMTAVSSDQIEQTPAGPMIHYMRLTHPFHTAPVMDFLLPGCSTRQEIEDNVRDYITFITNHASGVSTQQYLELLDPSVYFPQEDSQRPEISLLAGLLSIELFKNSIMTVEKHLLTCHELTK
jgi:uncharacterized protein with PQ loop repeat